MSSKVNDLRAMWNEHRAARFPAGLAGDDVEGVDLVSLDADIAACLEAYFGSAGRLDEARREVLETQTLVLNDLTPLIPESGRAHFARLLHLALGVLHALGRPSTDD